MAHYRITPHQPLDVVEPFVVNVHVFRPRRRTLQCIGEPCNSNPPGWTKCCACNKSSLDADHAYRCVEFRVDASNCATMKFHTYRFPGVWTYQPNTHVFEHLCKSCCLWILSHLQHNSIFTLNIRPHELFNSRESSQSLYNVEAKSSQSLYNVEAKS